MKFRRPASMVAIRVAFAAVLLLAHSAFGLNHLCVDEHWSAGIHPHPTDCSKFIECSNGIANELDCPAGLNFNKVALRCEVGECNTNTRPLTSAMPSIAVTKDPVGRFNHLCLDNKWSTGSLHTHPTECHKFIECVDGVGVEMVCPANLAFNPDKLYCDDPVKMNCFTYVTSPPVARAVRSSQDVSFEHFCVDHKWGTSTLHVHPTECHKFVECSNGLAYVLDCPAGLAFVPSVGQCDDAGRANCSTTATVAPGITKTPISGANPCVGKLRTSGVLPHPTDCSRYIECSSGIAYDMYCAAGLKFNAGIMACDNARNVDCSATVATTSDPVGRFNHLCLDNKWSTGSLHPHPTECHKFIECVDGVGVEMVCPVYLAYNPDKLYCDDPVKMNCFTYVTSPPVARAVRSPQNVSFEHFCADHKWGTSTLHVHPTECHKYVECSNGLAYVLDCPAGLAFVPSVGQCDDAGRANCSTTATETPGITKTPISGDVNDICRDLNLKNGPHAHPFQCHKFIECSFLVTYIMDCPVGEVFNSQMLTCQREADAPSCYFTALNETTVCGDYNLVAGIHPHPYKCDRFIECSNGNSYTIVCPKGLHYNVAEETCEDVHGVDCKDNYDFFHRLTIG